MFMGLIVQIKMGKNMRKKEENCFNKNEKNIRKFFKKIRRKVAFQNN